MIPVSRKLSFSSPSVTSFFFSRVLWPSSSSRMTSSPVSVLSSLAISDYVSAGRAGRPADCRCIMVKRIFKRILVFSSVACLVLACLPTVSFAIDPVSGAAALAGALDAYGMAYGVGTVYDVSSSSGVSSSFEGLWDEFSQYQSNAGSQFDYDSYIDNYNQNRSLYGFEHSSGKFAAWSIDAESAEIFDQFWNWLLTGPAEMTRVDNEYFEFSQSQVGPDAFPILVGSIDTSPFASVPVLAASTDITTQGLVIASTGNTHILCGANRQNIFVCSYVDGSFVYYSCFCSSTSFTAYFKDGNNSIRTTSSTSDSGIYRASYSVLSPSSYVGLVPSYSSKSDAINAFKSWNKTSSYDTVGVKAYGNGYVTVPDPTLADYVPTPIEIVTNIPWDSTYDDTDEEDGSPVPFPPVDVPLVVDDIITAISAEDYALEEDPQNPDPDAPPPAPSEVFVPLLPVGLPSFNFSFSGIWHYVREWVASLGAWFTTLFMIWGALPYAMVVPVYATAVVVIVLGVYKRFFM